jgi:hypothetical protein
MVDAIAGRQNEHRRVDVLLSRSPRDVESTATGQDQIEDDHVEHFALVRANPSSPATR